MLSTARYILGSLLVAVAIAGSGVASAGVICSSNDFAAPEDGGSCTQD